jgi:hypothetical protein
VGPAGERAGRRVEDGGQHRLAAGPRRPSHPEDPRRQPFELTVCDEVAQGGPAQPSGPRIVDEDEAELALADLVDRIGCTHDAILPSECAI